MLWVFLNILFLIYLDIAKPRLQKNPPDHLFISQLQKTKLCALPFMHLLTIALHFYTILPHSLSNANSHCYVRNVPAMPTRKGG